MNQIKLEKILATMNHSGVRQLLISDPAVIYYLTGVSIQPGERLLALVLRADGQNRFFINDLFHQTRDLGVPITYYNDTEDGVALVAKALIPGEAVAVDKNWPARFLLRLQELHTGKCVNSSSIVDGVRAIKTPEEQEKMRIASRLNDQVMDRIIHALPEDHTETELADLLLQYYLDAGCSGYSFEPITAFAGNAADPHHVTDGSRGKRGDCVVLDIGGRKDDYCSDMTRTFFCETADPDYAAIHDLVRSANEKAESLIRPGVRFCDLDKAARNVISEAGYGEYFTHRLGHSIGMQAHEAGDVSQGNSAKVQEGMTFSIEPGVYLPGKFGVRVEDLVLVTADGCEVLNHADKHWKVIG